MNLSTTTDRRSTFIAAYSYGEKTMKIVSTDTGIIRFEFNATVRSLYFVVVFTAATALLLSLPLA